jgi:hypothetical protein
LPQCGEKHFFRQKTWSPLLYGWFQNFLIITLTGADSQLLEFEPASPLGLTIAEHPSYAGFT